MQVSDNKELAEQAQEVLKERFGFNVFDETWTEEFQEDRGTCWTNGFEKISCIKPLIGRIEDAASSPTASQAVACCNDSSATGGGGTTGNSGN